MKYTKTRSDNKACRHSDDCVAVKSKNPEIVQRRGNPAVDNVLIERPIFRNVEPLYHQQISSSNPTAES